MNDKPVYTLEQWHKNIDRKTQTQLFEPTAILRDWGRDKIILEEQVATLRAKIDSLMFEFCPDEMTLEQITEWKQNQKVSGLTQPNIMKEETAMIDNSEILVRLDKGDAFGRLIHEAAIAIRAMEDELEGVNASHDDEEEAHKQTLRMLKLSQEQVKELGVQIKWIPVGESLPSDRREVDVVYRTEKRILDRAFDRYDINNGFSLDVTYWKYQTELPDG